MELTKKSFNVPLSEPQKVKLVQAAFIESENRGERIKPTTLFRELAMAGIDKILAKAPRNYDVAEIVE